MISCNDCKFADWDFRLFTGYNQRDFSSIPLYYSEQFDVHCKLHNKFFLEEDTLCNCDDGIFGENNLVEICKEQRRLIEKHNKLLVLFRKINENNLDVEFLTDTPEEYEVWTKWFKERDPELYKKFTDNCD